MRVGALFILIFVLALGVAGYLALQQRLRLKLRPVNAPAPRRLPGFQVSTIHPEKIRPKLAPAEEIADPAGETAAQGGIYLGPAGVVFQQNENDCGAAALKMVFEHYGIEASLSDLTQRLIDRQIGTSMLRLKEIAEIFGLSAEGWRIAERDLAGIPVPSIALLDRNHYVTLEAVEADGVVYADPALGRVCLPKSLFLRRSRGEMLLIRRHR